MNSANRTVEGTGPGVSVFDAFGFIMISASSGIAASRSLTFYVRRARFSVKKRSKFPWRLFWLLLAGGLTGVVAALPMLFDMVDQFVPVSEQQEVEANLPLPIPLLVLAALIQNGAVFGGAVALGLVLSERIGTGAPLLAAKLNGEPVPGWQRILSRAAAVGLLLGVVLAISDALVFLDRVPAALRDLGETVPLWKRLLAGLLYGGITEEILMRLFLFSLAVWLIGLAWRNSAGWPAVGAFWLANVVVAVLFALGHLPATQAITPLTPAVVARSLFLNGVASLTFGYLFWRRGLESAMVAHACAHVGLQMVGPALVSATTL